MKERKDRLNKEGKDWVARVTNTAVIDPILKCSVITTYNSKEDKIENILHKIELDLMTNLSLGLTGPIAVQIKEVK